MSLSLSPNSLYLQTTDCTEGGDLTREHCILKFHKLLTFLFWCLTCVHPQESSDKHITVSTVFCSWVTNILLYLQSFVIFMVMCSSLIIFSQFFNLHVSNLICKGQSRELDEVLFMDRCPLNKGSNIYLLFA